MTPEELQREVDEVVNRVLRDDFQGTWPDPEVLYHYTDSAGFMGLVSTQKIWATHIAFMNDPGEAQHTHELLRHVGSQYGKATKWMIAVAEHLSQGDVVRSQGTFAACLTTQGDSLSQWRAYAGDGLGFALGIDARSIRSALDIGLAGKPAVDCAGPIALQVIYDDTEKKRILRTILDLSFVSRNPGEEFSSPRLIAIATTGARRLLGLCAMAFKSDAFVEEQERRLVWLGPFMGDKTGKSTVAATPPNPLVPLRFRMTRYGFAPYLDWSIERDGKTLLREVVLGPKHNDASARAVEMFLRWNGCEAVKVTRSKATYR